MYSSRKRFFRIYKLKLKPIKTKTDAPMLPLFSKEKNDYSLCRILELVKERQENITILKNDNFEILLKDLKIVDQYLILFFIRYDLNINKVIVASNEEDNPRSRVLDKKDDEKLVNSIHLIIGIRDNELLAVLEEVDGVPMGTLVSLLNNMLKETSCEYRNNNDIDDKISYKICAEGFLSENLEKSLESGKIQGVCLVKPAEKKLSKDSEINNLFEGKEEILKIKLIGKKKKSIFNVIFLQKLLKERGYERLKFQLSVNHKKKTIAMMRDDEAREKLFVCAHEVTFDTDLDPFTDSINQIIVNKAIEQFEK